MLKKAEFESKAEFRVARRRCLFRRSQRFIKASWFMALGRRNRECGEFRYFDSISFVGRILLRFLRASGLFSMQVSKVDYFMGDLRRENGTGVWFGLFRDEINDVCDAIIEGESKRSSLIDKLVKKGLDRNRLLLYLEKRIHVEIAEKAFHINVIKTGFRQKGPLSVTPLTFLNLMPGLHI